MSAITQLRNMAVTFYCQQYPGLTLWQRTRCFQFRGGYLTIDDPDGAAQIRMTDYFRRGQIVELAGGQAPASRPQPLPHPALWKIDLPKPLPAVPRQEQSPPSEPPPHKSWPNGRASPLLSRPGPDALADRHYQLAPFRLGPKPRTPPPPEPTVPLTSPFHPARATHLPLRLHIACAFLTQLLANGEVPSSAVWARARQAGVRRQAQVTALRIDAAAIDLLGII